jgi:hypothetical protein
VATALFAANVPPASAADAVVIRPGSTVEFAGTAAGARILSSRDAFVEEMSPFDRSARLKTAKDVSEAEYLAFVGRQTREWSPEEKARIMPILEAFRRKTADLNLRFPPSIPLVKTTGLEEGQAAYCRGTAIVVPEALVQQDPARLETVLFHELFHIYRTSEPARRAGLYRIIGFEVSPEIALPAELRPRKITNPDAPRTDSFIRLRAGDESVLATPVLFAKTDRYDEEAGGEFFESMVFKLMILRKTRAGFEPAILPGKGVDLRGPAELPDYLERIGRNTDYIIHPEEILADNFVLMVQQASPVPTPRIPQEMRALLTK